MPTPPPRPVPPRPATSGPAEPRLAQPGARRSRALLLAALLPAAWGVAQTAAVAAAVPPPHPAVRTAPPTAGASARQPENHSSGLVPIALGLVLTGIAVYKHRGLPRGH
jgi:hypothetical protein